jgi:hypothetical protein
MACVVPERQTVISGPYRACLNLSGFQQAVGWPHAEPGESYALRLRRDRVLVVNGPVLADGWNAEHGVAVSDMTDGFAVIDLQGSDCLFVLRRGTEVSIEMPSASCIRLFAGHEVILFSRGTDAYRLHVARGHLEAIWVLLTTYAIQASEQSSEQ